MVKRMRILPIIIIALASMTNACAEAIGFESGVYENLLLAINSDGAVTGYYRETQGEGTVKTCVFTFKGKAHADNANIVVNTDQTFAGEIQAETESINLKIEKAREIPGCGLVLMPEIASGLSYALITKASWTELRTIVSNKSYFYSEPKSDKKLKSYLVKGDVVGVLATEGDWLKIEYYSDSGKTSRRWISSKETASF